MENAKGSTPDMTRLYRCLEEARAKLERVYSAGPRDKERILKERARRLAEEVGQVSEREDENLLVFKLAHERYAVETAYVRDVRPFKGLTGLPCTPSYVLGITNVRGQIISVIDLKPFFGFANKEPLDRNQIVILSDGRMEFGVLADDVLGTQSITLSDLQPPPPTLTGTGLNYILGVTEDQLIVLAAARILADSNIVVEEEVEP